MTIARMKYPDIPLKYHFHSFGVNSASDGRVAVNLISRHGLYSLEKSFGLRNITGDLSWSLMYGKDAPVQVLTVVTNEHGFLKRSGAGIAEYGIGRKATVTDKKSLVTEIDVALANDPNNELGRYPIN